MGSEKIAASDLRDTKHAIEATIFCLKTDRPNT